MLNIFTQKKSVFFRKLWASVILMTFVSSIILPPAGAQSILNLPIPGSSVALTPGFAPILMKGINLYPDQPFKFDFIIDQGDSKLSDEDFKKQSTQLIKYFLASLTIPEDDMWVNLSPYEKNRIVQEDFGKTEMGRDLLAQDYMLKQLTASLMNPKADLGSEFWKRVYQKAQDQYGTKEIPLNTFNKIWIVPQKAVVYESAKGAFITKSHLKVMLEEDYLALKENGLTPQSNVQSPIIKDLLIPEIEKEVNEGKTFANLRQIYNSVILAAWYKQAITQSLLNQVYTNQKKISGVDVEDKNINEKIYTQYVESFKKGVFNFIKEDVDPKTQELIPRKYFSGGANIGEVKKVLERTHDIAILPRSSSGLREVTADMASSSATDEIFLFSAIFNAPQDYWESGNGEKAILDYVQKLKGYLDSTWRTPTDVFKSGIETLITAPISSIAEFERLYLLHKEIWKYTPQLGFLVLRFAADHVDRFLLTDDRELSGREINKNWSHTAFDSVYLEQMFAIAEESMGSAENLANWFAENIDLGDSLNRDFVQQMEIYFPDLSAKYLRDEKFKLLKKFVFVNARQSLNRKTIGYQITRGIHSHLPVAYADFNDLSGRVDQVMASLWQDAPQERTYQQLKVNDIIRLNIEGNKTVYLTVMDVGEGTRYLLYLDGRTDAVMSYFPSNGGTYMKDFDKQTYTQVNKIEVLTPKPEVVDNPEAFLNTAFKNRAAASSSIWDSFRLSNLLFKTDESIWASGKTEADIHDFVLQLRDDLRRVDMNAKVGFELYVSSVLNYAVNSIRDLEKIFILYEAIWEYVPEVGLEALKFSANHVRGYMVPDRRERAYSAKNMNWPHTLFDAVNLEQQFVIAERALGSADKLADWFVQHMDMSEHENQRFVETLSMYFPHILDKYFTDSKFVQYISQDSSYSPMIEKQSILGYRIAAKVQQMLPIPYSEFDASYSGILIQLDGLWQSSREVTQLSDLNINDIVRVTYQGGQTLLMTVFDRGSVNVHFLFLDGGNDAIIQPRYADNQLFLQIYNNDQFFKVEKIEVLTPNPEVVANPEVFLNSSLSQEEADESSVSSSSTIKQYAAEWGTTPGELEAMFKRGLTYEEAQRMLPIRNKLKVRYPTGIWTNEITAKNMVLAALDTVEGFKEARERGVVADMAKLYRERIISYVPENRNRTLNNGQIAFFKANGGLDGLANSQNVPFIINRGRISELLRIAVPELINPDDPNALTEEDLSGKFYSRNVDSVASSAVSIKIQRIQDILGISAEEVQKMVEQGVSYEDASKIRDALKINKFQLPDGFWRSKETAKNFILVALDTIPGFKEERQKGSFEGMADLYRAHVMTYEPKGTRKENGQFQFFIEVGGLGTLMLNKDKILEEANSPAALLNFAIPGLISNDLFGLSNAEVKARYLKPVGRKGSSPAAEVSTSSAVNKNNVGGIDLNSKYLNIEIHRDGKGMPILFTPEELKHINIPGLVPVISNIQPVISLELLFKP